MTTVAPVQRWTAEAPSNIALIKFMGKVETAGNRPTNTSLSFTLDHLKSLVQLEFDSRLTNDVWEPLTNFGDRQFAPLKLSQKGVERFLAHLALIKATFDFKGFFHVRSANDFPSDCGLASSASSFAALTKVGVGAMAALTERDVPSMTEVAELSRRGSGSSCRSFFGPWSLWAPDHVGDVPSLATKGKLFHQVVVVDDHVKAVSSSEAHKRVTSSLLFAGRPNRADVRSHDLIKALELEHWEEAFQISWAEFWDMHALFETSVPSFGYMTAGSLEILSYVRDTLWAKEKDGPIVTMDAGPNVHLLYRRDEKGLKLASQLAATIKGHYKIISSEALA